MHGSSSDWNSQKLCCKVPLKTCLNTKPFSLHFHGYCSVYSVNKSQSCHAVLRPLHLDGISMDIHHQGVDTSVQHDTFNSSYDAFLLPVVTTESKSRADYYFK